MFTKPEITNPEDLSSRGYVSFYFDKKRKRFYHGASVGLDCHPHQCTSLRTRFQELERLQYHLHRLLLAGWNPLDTEEHEGVKVLTLLSKDFITDMTKDLNMSQRHLDDQIFHAKRFLKYLTNKGLEKISSIDLSKDIADDYLKQATSNNNYYMIIRNRLQCLFTIYYKKHHILVNPFLATDARRKIPQLNKAYTKNQLDTVLQTMKITNERLYLCGLLMYGCFLRPHEEIRNLKRKHFNHDFSRIILSGEENKGRDIRITPVPTYVKIALSECGVNTLHLEKYLFTISRGRVVNEDYFSNAWKKVKKQLLAKNLIEKDHTLYSIRHTAAVNLFNKTQNLAKLSQVMGHKDVAVTITYLRSLGILLHIDESDMPEL
jgi:site-specific recombinase XerD